jgi:hypothetical protein
MDYARPAIAFPVLELEAAADADAGKIEITPDLLNESLDYAESLDAAAGGVAPDTYVEAAALPSWREESWARVVGLD